MSKDACKEVYCGECPLFKHECADGYGYCSISQCVYRCGDLCKFITDGMYEQETLRMLHYCQRWPRGANIKMPPPTLFGLAIDSAIRIIRAIQKQQTCNHQKH